MQYCTKEEVASLFKSAQSYATLGAAEVQLRLNEANLEINNTLRNLYRVPLTVNPASGQVKFSTTVTVNAAAAATSITVASVGSSSGVDNKPYWLEVGNRIYLDYNTGVMEAQTISSISGLVLTLVSPTGNSLFTAPIQHTGLYNAHSSGATVITSDSLDQLNLACTRLAYANIVDIYFAASDNSDINEQAALNRHFGEMFLADIIEGNVQFVDMYANAEKPIYPQSLGATTGVVWDGISGNPGTPAFTKDTRPVFIKEDFV